MAKFRINGPCVLNGTVTVGGSKNAALPILAATLLAREPVTLTRVPEISDVAVMIEILEHFGMRVTRAGGTVTLDPSALKPAAVPDELARSLRASILLLGPALARFGEYASVHPGGDVIGKRPLDAHFEGLTALGATVTKDHATYHVSGKLQGATVFLHEPSVTATENVMMAAAVSPGETVIKNAASELHVRDLGKFLTTLGATVTGAGTNQVKITGVEQLGGGAYEVRADEVEAATFVIAAAVTGGEVVVDGIDTEHLGVIPRTLQMAGINLTVEPTRFIVKPPHQLTGTDLTVGTWPNFPTDIASPYTVLMTQATGTSLVHEWMYEGRLVYTDKLVSMGANIVMADPHRILVTGPTPLQGRELETPDIRAGITMVVAALVAEGETVIDRAELIERGYERIDERLRSLGAEITRIA